MTRGVPLSAASHAPDAAFLALVAVWSRDQAALMLKFVWQAYDTMLGDMPAVDGRDLERSITQLLEPRIRAAMTGDEPFYIQHGSYERETMAPPPAQPPAYDLAFVIRADERVMWPLEAKVLETPRAVAEYVGDVRSEFLTCRYAPFSSSGAMVGYLLVASADDALEEIARRLRCELSIVPDFESRPHRVSVHDRAVPNGKNYPTPFHCHHLILEYYGLRRERLVADGGAARQRQGFARGSGNLAP